MSFVRGSYDPQGTLVLAHDRVLGRQLHFYCRLYGFRCEWDEDLTADHLRHREHVLKLQREKAPRLTGPWLGGAVPRGRWQIDVPQWRVLSPQSAFWNVGLYEVQGPYVSLGPGWRQDEEGL